jgi:exodeoxyribonuclease VII large subunit
MRAALRRGLDRRRLRLSRAAQVLARHSPRAELARAGEKLKGLSARLHQGLFARIALAKQERAGAKQRLNAASERLALAFLANMRERREKLARLEQLRQSLGHASVLARGFALVRDEDNRLVRAAAAVAAGQRLRLQFADGEIAAKALGGKEPVAGGEPPRGHAPPPPEKPRPAPARKRKNDDQGSLF